MTYSQQVNASLRKQGAAPLGPETEWETCRAGQSMGVGPGDCAAQIMADREELQG